MNDKNLLFIKNELEVFINQITVDYRNKIYQNADIIISLTASKLKQISSFFDKIDKPCFDTEIFFFKNVKPRLLGYIQFCKYVKTLELSKSVFKFRQQKDYYLKELFNLKNSIKSIDYFYSYSNSHLTHKDKKYFTRSNTIDMISVVGNIIIEIDPRSNTPFVPIFAQIEAYKLFKEYLKNKIKAFNNPNVPDNKNNNLQWTASKTDLTELVYALHASGVFNNGKATLKDIVTTFQEIFQTDLSQHNRIFYDIKLRKSNKTKHIDTLRELLHKKINDADFQLFVD